MPINASPHYKKAEGEYLASQTTEQKIRALKKMISLAPSHKGAENLRAQLKKRLAKFKYTKEQAIKKRKSAKSGIKKEDMQAVIIGVTNTGKSSLLSLLTNANPKVASYEFTTKNPVIGIMQYAGVNIQIIEIPAFESEYYDKGLVNSTDVILILINELRQIDTIEKELINATRKRIIVFNIKTNNIDIRKLEATMKSKKLNYLIINTKTLNTESLKALKEKIFQSFNKIRIYTKEPGKAFDAQSKKDKPIILEKGSFVRDVAEKILHGFSERINQVKIWGPSSKFPGQVVGLKHELKDLDIVEFKTR